MPEGSRFTGWIMNCSNNMFNVGDGSSFGLPTSLIVLKDSSLALSLITLSLLITPSTSQSIILNWIFCPKSMKRMKEKYIISGITLPRLDLSDINGSWSFIVESRNIACSEGKSCFMHKFFLLFNFL